MMKKHLLTLLILTAIAAVFMTTETQSTGISLETSTSAGFYVLTRDGVVRVSFTGSKQIVIEGCGGYSIEIGNNEIYCSGIRIYDLEGNYLRTISTSKPYITFVTLPAGRIALLDNANDKVYFIDSSGNLLATTNILDSPDTQLQNLDGVVVGNKLILSEDGNGHVLQIDLNTYERSIFKDLSSLPHWLGAITYAGGQYYVCGPRQIYIFDEGSDVIKVAEIPEGNITGIVVIGNDAYVSVNFTGRIYKVDLGTGASGVLASVLNYPEDIEVFLLRQFLPLVLKNTP